ncbi:hypothetical protein CTA2_1739 [Colletotrichum tanaceti]|nr:hypothetical protein CTA2_1739 [Colletotrichum tanaceti]
MVTLDCHRQSHHQGRPHLASGRGHGVPGLSHREADPGRPRACDRGPHHHHHRASPVHHHHIRPDRGAPQGQGGRARHARRAAVAGRALPCHVGEADHGGEEDQGKGGKGGRVVRDRVPAVSGKLTYLSCSK